MTAAADPTPSRIFYGWWIVAAGFLSQAVAIGMMAYSGGTFLKPILGELELGRTWGMVGLTAMNATMALVSPLIGMAFDRQSVRLWMSFGALAFAGGLAALGAAPSAGWTLPALVVIGMGGASVSTLAAGVLVARWFRARRGFALGVSAVGTSFGGLVMSPVAAALIESLGWRGALFAIAGFVALLLAPLLALVVVDQPGDRGLHPDGADTPPPAADGTPDVELAVAMLLRDGRYWTIIAPIALTFGCFTGIMANLVPHATDAGIPLLRASLLMSCLAGCGVIGKLAFGAIADRAPLRPALAVAIGLAGTGTAALLSVDTFSGLVAASCVLGLSTGGMLPVWGALIAEAFGPAAFGRVMGFMQPAIFPLSLASMLFAGAARDATGSYTLAFEVYVGAFALAAILALFARGQAPAIEGEDTERRAA